MKKRLLLFLMVIVSFTATSQVNGTLAPSGTASQGTRFKAGIQSDSLLILPVRKTNTLYPNLPLKGRIQYNSTNNRVEYNNGTSWNTLSDGSDNHTGLFINYTAQFNTTVGNIQTFINNNSRTPSGSFTVTETTKPVYIQVTENLINGNGRRLVYAFIGGTGTWGNSGFGGSGTATTASMFKLLSSTPTTVQDVSNDPNTQTISLGSLPTGDYVTAANSVSRDLSNPELVYYFSYTQDGVLYLVQFIGSNGVYGGSGTQLVSGDFAAATNSGVTPEQGLESVLTNSNHTGNNNDIIFDNERAAIFKGGNEGTQAFFAFNDNFNLTSTDPTFQVNGKWSPLTVLGVEADVNGNIDPTLALSGQFIPLSGTTEGNSVTGTVEFSDAANGYSGSISPNSQILTSGVGTFINVVNPTQIFSGADGANAESFGTRILNTGDGNPQVRSAIHGSNSTEVYSYVDNDVAEIGLNGVNDYGKFLASQDELSTELKGSVKNDADGGVYNHTTTLKYPERTDYTGAGDFVAKLQAKTGTLALLSDITGGGITVPTNLTYTASPTGGTVNSSTGTGAIIPPANTTDSGLFLPDEKAKLASYPNVFNTDNVPETTTNKYVSTAAVLPTIASGKIGYNTTFSTVPNAANALVWNKGYFVSDGVKNIPLGLDTRLVSSLNAIGDSFTNNFNLTANDGYLNKVGNFRGWAITNSGTNGATVATKYKGLYSPLNAEVGIVALGINDVRQYGTAGIPAYINMMTGLLTSFNSSEAVKGQAWTKTTPADWTTSNVFFDTTTGSQTNVNNSPANFTTTGDVIFVTVAYEVSGTTNYTITIDGVSQGSFVANSTALVGYPTPTGTSDTNYYPFTHRFGGLTRGLHTVTITKTGGTALRLIGGLGNGKLKIPYGNRGLAIYVNSAAHMNSTGYTTYPGNIAGLNDAMVDAQNSALFDLCTTLAKDGFQIQYVDVNKYYDPNLSGNVMADGLHPTGQGYTYIFNADATAMAAYNLVDRQLIQAVVKGIGEMSPAISGKVSKTGDTMTGTLQFDPVVTNPFLYYSNFIDAANYARLNVTRSGNDFSLLAGSLGSPVAPNFTIGSSGGRIMFNGANSLINVTGSFLGLSAPFFPGMSAPSATTPMVYGANLNGINSNGFFAAHTFRYKSTATGTGGSESLSVIFENVGTGTGKHYLTTWKTLSGGTTTLKAGVLDTGQIEIPAGTQPEHAANVGQVQTAVFNKSERFVTASTTLTTSDYYVGLTSGTANFTFPTGLTTNMEFVIKNKGAGILTAIGTFDGVVNKTFSTQGSGMRVIWNGASYDIIGLF